ncbi:uncharacterized protein KGF55_003523 [Candida pseudojiufengensis]|uniref:uncharacterized protein n=1 Tax=Candida pseudojiufengensis TaxID=497109 RepID=UPI002225561A|nr:uncharacterized protein KGF55_003523 [Candida pseudojiufengensis]KAI5962447.1 hypothetical protein KGF55_003523 [Candida pseudojiufengensis]
MFDVGSGSPNSIFSNGFAASQLSRHLNKPSLEHMEHIKYVKFRLNEKSIRQTPISLCSKLIRTIFKFHSMIHFEHHKIILNVQL